jgi:hypothetical protein
VAALELLLERLTTTPPDGAAAFSVTVPVELATVPITLVGLSVRVETTIGWTVRDAVLLVPAYVAVTSTVLVVETSADVMVNVPVVCPAATVTVAGIDAPVPDLERATDRPPVGAAPSSVTVPVALAAEPMTLVGLIASDAGRGALTVNCADDDVRPKLAVMVTVTSLPTGIVETENAWDEEPAAKFSVAGVEAAPLLLVSVIVAPPVGAPVFRVTVASVPAPPVSDVCASVIEVTVSVSTVRVWVNVAVPLVAVIVASVVTETISDVTVKVALVWPAGTVTVAGTVAALVAELEREMLQPPLGAAPSNVTVPVALAFPPRSVDLSSVKLIRFGGVTVKSCDAEEL